MPADKVCSSVLRRQVANGCRPSGNSLQRVTFSLNPFTYRPSGSWHGNCIDYSVAAEDFAAEFRQCLPGPLQILALHKENDELMLIDDTQSGSPHVGKLTESPIRRRIRVVGRAFASQTGLLAGLLLGIPAPAVAETPQWQPVDQIASTAEDFLRARTGVFNGDTEVRASPLDARHRLAFCNRPLEAFLRNGTDISARTIVGVRCAGEKPWKIYVPVNVVVTAGVLVARQTLTKGQVLTAADLALEKRDVSRMRGGFLTDPQQVIGQRLKTQLIAGKTLKPSMFEVDIAIRRGQTVTLTVNTGGFNITMLGTALSDGAVDQRIRVKNNHSGRIVEGIVRSREQVEILVTTSSSFFHAEPKVSPMVADTRFSNNDR